MTGLVIATAREEIGSFISALVLVYTIILVGWVILSLVLSLGVRIPYARWSSAILDFLRDVSEPYLRIFRRFIPMIGPLDLSPMVAIFVLQIVGNLIAGVIQG